MANEHDEAREFATPCPNKFAVGIGGAGRGNVVIMRWGRIISTDDALCLAAWIVALVDPNRQHFDRLFDDVCNT